MIKHLRASKTCGCGRSRSNIRERRRAFCRRRGHSNLCEDTHRDFDALCRRQARPQELGGRQTEKRCVSGLVWSSCASKECALRRPCTPWTPDSSSLSRSELREFQCLCVRCRQEGHVPWQSRLSARGTRGGVCAPAATSASGNRDVT
eukprot:3913337-Rhodomonas_salina.1